MSVSATVCNRLRECDKLSTEASASGAILKACQVDSLSSFVVAVILFVSAEEASV